MKETTDSFGQVIARVGERVRLTTKDGQTTLTATVDRAFSTSGYDLRVIIDGASGVNYFRVSDWNVEVIAPPLEDGYYRTSGSGRIYAVRSGKITHSMMREGDKASVSTFSPEGFANAVAEGAMTKVADL